MLELSQHFVADAAFVAKPDRDFSFEDDESAREWKDLPLEFDSHFGGGDKAGDVGLEKNDHDTPDAGLDLS